MKIEVEIYQRPYLAKGWFWKVYYFPIGIYGHELGIPLELGGYCRTQKKAEKKARKEAQWIKTNNGSRANSYTIDLSEE